MIVGILAISFLASSAMSVLTLMLGYSLWATMLVYVLTGSVVTGVMAVIASFLRTPDENLSTRDSEMTQQNAYGRISDKTAETA